MVLLSSLASSLVLLFTIQSSCFAAKFVMTPMFGRSHYRVLARLGEELRARGHEVRFINARGQILVGGGGRGGGGTGGGGFPWPSCRRTVVQSNCSVKR